MGFVNRRRSVSLLTLAALAAGCSAGASGASAPEDPSAPGATTVTSSATRVASRDFAKDQWRRQMSKKPLPKEGCFDAVHPGTQWRWRFPARPAGIRSRPIGRCPRVQASTAEHASPTAVSGPVAPDSNLTGDATPERSGASTGTSSHPPAGAVVESGIQPFTSGSVSSGTISCGGRVFPQRDRSDRRELQRDVERLLSAIEHRLEPVEQRGHRLVQIDETPSSCTGWVQFVYWGGAAEIWYNLIGAGVRARAARGRRTAAAIATSRPPTRPRSPPRPFRIS